MRILCRTSNDYHCFLPAFFYYFKKYWGREEHIDLAGYEKVPKDLPDWVTYISLGKAEDVTWSSATLTYLNSIQDEKIIFFLDDLFIRKPVRLDLVDALADELMDKYGAVKASLWGDLGSSKRNPPIGTYKDAVLTRQSPFCFWSACPAPGIWRVSSLKAMLRPTENVWEFERRGTRDSLDDGRLIMGTDIRIVEYANGSDRGEWNYISEGTIQPDMWEEIKREGIYRPPKRK